MYQKFIFKLKSYVIRSLSSLICIPISIFQLQITQAHLNELINENQKLWEESVFQLCV